MNGGLHAELAKKIKDIWGEIFRVFFFQSKLTIFQSALIVRNYFSCYIGPICYYICISAVHRGPIRIRTKHCSDTH